MGIRNIDCHSGAQIYGKIIIMSQINMRYLPNIRKNGERSAQIAKKWIIPQDIRTS